MKELDFYISEKLHLDKNTKTTSYKPIQGEHDKSKVYDDIWNDIKDSLYKWNAGPVYGFKGDKGVSFQVNLDGKFKGYWIVIKYDKGWNDSFLITLSKYATDDLDDVVTWDDNIYAGQEPQYIDILLGI